MNNIFNEIESYYFSNLHYKEKYARLYGLLDRVCKQLTADEPTDFSNLFARLYFLCKQKQIKSQPIEIFRIHARQVLQSNEFLYTDEDYQYDVKALCETLCALLDTPISERLQKSLPTHWRALPQAHYTSEKRKRIRMVVDNWNEEFIYGFDESYPDNAPLQVSYTAHFSELNEMLYKGAQLNLLSVTSDEAGILQAELIIFEPDYLIDISSLSACYTNYGDTPLNYLMNKFRPQESTPYILLGNAANQFLDDCINESNETPASFESSIQKAFRTDLLAYCCTPQIDRSYFQKAEEQFNHIQQTLETLFHTPSYHFDRNKVMLEPSFLCESMGLQGRMDLLQSDGKNLIELKSGKADGWNGVIRAKASHALQMALYKEVLFYNLDIPREEVRSYLFYSAYPKLYAERSAKGQIQKAISLRNQIVANEIRLKNGEGEALLEHLTSDSFNERNDQSKLWCCYQRPQIEAWLMPFRQASPLEKAYFYHFLSFTEKEQFLSKTGDSKLDSSRGFADIWNADLTTKQEGGNILIDLIIKGMEEKESNSTSCGQREGKQSGTYRETEASSALKAHKVFQEKSFKTGVEDRTKEEIKEKSKLQNTTGENESTEFAENKLKEGNEEETNQQNAAKKTGTAEIAGNGFKEEIKERANQQNTVEGNEKKSRQQDVAGETETSEIAENRFKEGSEENTRQQNAAEETGPTEIAKQIKESEGIERLFLNIPFYNEGFLPNFRKGDIVLFYERNGEKDNVTNRQVFRGNIEYISDTELVIKLRYKQRNKQVFNLQSRYALEHDFMDGSYNTLYKGLYAFLTAPSDRRDLLLGQRPPRIDHSRTLNGRYLNEQIDRIVLQAKQAEDYFLLVGPPGTGKTSVALKSMVEEFYSETSNQILLLSYTNRAVDEICDMLERIEKHPAYLRIGSELACEERFRPRLMQNITDQCGNREAIIRTIESIRIVVGTTASISGKPELFKLKHFQVAIIDEASQILEPQILGILCAQNSTQQCAIDKFILIGDPKQLPAVVQQNPSESVVTNKLLTEIGLTDRRNSLFERIYRWLQIHPQEGILSMLNRQGRMHPEVNEFANHCFYGGLLDIVPVKHQTEDLEFKIYPKETAEYDKQTSNSEGNETINQETIYHDIPNQEPVHSNGNEKLSQKTVYHDALNQQPTDFGEDETLNRETAYCDVLNQQPGNSNEDETRNRKTAYCDVLNQQPENADGGKALGQRNAYCDIPNQQSVNTNGNGVPSNSLNLFENVNTQTKHRWDQKGKWTVPSSFIRMVATTRVGFIPSGFPPLEDSNKVNRNEAEIIALLVQSIYELCSLNGLPFQAAKRIGIIVPFRNQIALIGKALKELQLPETENITIDTVERYQGSQREIILYSATISQPYQLDILSTPIQDNDTWIDRKLNVALTRAQKQLFVTGNEAILRHSPIYNKFIEKYLISLEFNLIENFI